MKGDEGGRKREGDDEEQLQKEDCTWHPIFREPEAGMASMGQNEQLIAIEGKTATHARW